MLKTMVLCLLSFLFGVYTGRIFWRKSNGCDEQLLEPLTFLSPSHACIEAEHVTSGSKWCHLLLCEGACECPKKPTEGDLFASGMAILFSLVFPSSLGQGFCLFVSASEGCRQLLESLACSHLPYSEAELHNLSKLFDVQTGRFLWFSSFWSLQVPSATLSATRPDFKPTWPGNRQMHAHMLAWAFFIFQECLYVFNCRMCRSAFVELLCFFWDASRLKHLHSWLHSRRSCQDAWVRARHFLSHVFDSCSPLAHLTPLTLAKVYENLMISNDEIKDGECGWKQGVDQVTFAEVEVPGFLPAFDLSTLCLFSLKICGHVLTCSPFWLERDASLGGGKWKNESIVLKRRIYSNDLVVGHFLNVMLVLFVSFTLVMSWRRPTSPTESPRTGKERIQRAQERPISVHSPCYSWTVVSCWDEDRANDCHVVCKGASILNELHLEPHFGATWHCTAKHFCWSWRVLAVVLQANKQHASRQLQFWCTLVYMPSLVASKYRVKSWLRSTILEGDGAICAVLWWYLKLGWVRILLEMGTHTYAYLCIYIYIHVRSHIRIQILCISSWIEVVNSVFGACSDVLMWCEPPRQQLQTHFWPEPRCSKTSLHLAFSDLKMWSLA